MPEITKVTFTQTVLKPDHGFSAHVEKCVKMILDSFAKMADNDFGVRTDLLEGQWNENLLQLGEVGLPEARQLLIKGVY